MESPERMYEESGVLAEGSVETTPSRKPSTNPAEPIKKTRLFSLVNSAQPTAAIAVTRSESTQLDFHASSFHSSQNLDISNPFFISNYPSQRFRRDAYEAAPYYSPSSTIALPESSNNMKVQDQTSLAVLSPGSRVREIHF